MLNIQDSKIILKNSTISGQVPTVAPSNDHTDGAWTATDIYEGEIMANVADSKVWMRMNAGIREFLITRNNSATGDLYYVGSGTWQRLPIGTSGQVLTVSSGGIPTWEASTGGGGASGGVPTTRTITINGVTQDLSADRTYNVGDMLKSVYDTDDDGTVDSAETIRIIVRNSTGSTLTKGQVVYLSGATGNRPNAVLADADTAATAKNTIGIVQANITNNSDGYVVVDGTMHDLNTSSFSAGDTLWLSTTAGAMVANTPPAEPAYRVFIGFVARSHPNFGRIVLNIKNGYDLDELHGVLITSAANNDILQYETSSGLWKNKTFPTLTSGTVTSVAVAAGTTGSDINISGSPITTSGTITINIPTASSTNRGALSSTDWTTFNQKSGVFMHRIAPTAFNPLDATTYYAGDLSASLDWGTTAAARRHYVAASFQLIAASIMVRVAGTIGSGESGTLAIRKNNTTDFTISTGVLMNAANVYVQATGLSGASFVSGDYFELKFTTPTWATNPTNVNLIVALYFR
jgi:enamine deaminase RidA (YjgF/YER057c/UK114 family)